jgi:endonuclease YncB( thermonuclease family)
VIDGDTFETASRKHPVRLAGVDTPEKGQPGYAAARHTLSRLIEDKTVEINTRGRDSFGRSVANVKVDGRSVNRATKKHGA